MPLLAIIIPIIMVTQRLFRHVRHFIQLFDNFITSHAFATFAREERESVHSLISHLSASDEQKGASQIEAPILNNDNKSFLPLGYLLFHE